MLAVLQGEVIRPAPIWLMRQAGRYLPEYRALRAQAGSFLDLCYMPELAAEVTLQPIRRYGFDAAILFSDILVIPQALGQTLRFEAGEGPNLSPAMTADHISSLRYDPLILAPIYETVQRVVAALPPAVTMIGFAGAPWTVATYMVEGRGSRDHEAARRLASVEPAAFQQLIDKIVDATVDYLSQQIKAGAEVVQLFDSWAGILPPDQFETWVVAPTQNLVKALRHRHPATPIIGFPRGIGAKIDPYVRQTKVDALGIDETMDLTWVHQALPPGLPVQGNLDPMALIAGGDRLLRCVARISRAVGDRPFVFNLGHGIWPETPIEHVDALLQFVRQEGHCG
jgi:uroporphyrinogen decarboxylase